MQYSSSIDDFARIMKDGNNGGYANNWLVADSKTNEIAKREWSHRITAAKFHRIVDVNDPMLTLKGLRLYYERNACPKS